jgi:chromosomal replication initiation ATPase DnaA
MSSGVVTQLTFDLGRHAALRRSDFLVSESNASAVGWIDRWPDWPTGALVLHGPSSCGKTHLVHLWCHRASAIAISGDDLDEEEVARLVDNGCYRIAVDDGDRASEHAFLHLHNFCLENRGSLLVTARQPPGRWAVALRDLGSRLRAALPIGIAPPDDALLGGVLVKHFADRQLRVAPEVISYLLRQMERSFAAAANITALLDQVSLRDGRPITVPLVRELLKHSDHPPPRASDSGVK